MKIIREGFDRLCGACHVHGDNPKFVDEKCTTCERTREQIQVAHGIIELDSAMKCVVFARKAQAELKYSKGEIITLLVEGLKE